MGSGPGATNTTGPTGSVASGAPTGAGSGSGSGTSATTGGAGVGGAEPGPCSSSFDDVSLPLCDGTYADDVGPGTFAGGAHVRAQNPGAVVFTGSFAPGDGLSFRGIVVTGPSQKELGANNDYDLMSFVGGPACENTVTANLGTGTSVRRSAFYGRGGRYQILAYQVTDVTLEDILIRTDGGWGESGGGCTEFEPNAALNFYDSSHVSCTRCVLFDGIFDGDASSSETLGGLGVNCHGSADDEVFTDSLIVASQGGFYAEGHGSCGGTQITNSASYGTTWGLKQNVGGVTTASRFTTDGNCGVFGGSIELVDSQIQGENNGCSGATQGAGGMPVLDTAFLDAPRWRKELCDDAGVSRGWCATDLSLSAYLASVAN